MNDNSPTLLDLDTHNHTARLTLNRPDQRNALSIELLECAHEHLDRLASQPIRTLVITGAGKAFCAGMDLKQVTSDPDAPLRLLTLLADLTLKIRRLPAITIASTNGYAIGGGCGLACVCDLTVTHPDAKLGFPEVDLGLCPAVVAPWLVRKIGPGPARRVLLSGGTMSGSKAHQLGIATDLVQNRDDLDAFVRETVERLHQGGPRAVAATKSLLNELDGSLDEQLLKEAAQLSASVLSSPEAQQTLRRFFK